MIFVMVFLLQQLLWDVFYAYHLLLLFIHDKRIFGRLEKGS